MGKKKRRDVNPRRPARGLPPPFRPGWEDDYTKPCEQDRRPRRANCSRTNGTPVSPSTATETVKEANVLPVKQAELRELQECREVARKTKKLAASIRERVLAGADVEPGTIEATVDQTESIQFSFAKVSAVIGKAAAEKLKSRIEPTTQLRLLLTRATRGGRD